MFKLIAILFLSIIAFAKEIPCDKIIDNGIIKICYNNIAKGANYVDYVVSGKNVNLYNIKKRPRFYRDKHINKKNSTTANDYINTTDSLTHKIYFDRGHMAPDADFDYSKKTLLKVYTMANIVPQRSELNKYAWKKIEERERQLAIRENRVNVRSGALYENYNLYLDKRDFSDIIKDRERKYHKDYSDTYLKKQYKKYLKYKKRLKKKHILIPTKLYKIISYNNKKECYFFDNIKNKLISNSCIALDNYLSNEK